MTLTLRLLLTMFAGFLINVGLTPIIIHLAHRNQWYDETNHRKIHTEDIPRLGGFGIFMGILVSAFVAIAVSSNEAGFASLLLHFAPVIAGLLIINIVGLIDDFRNLRALTKFIVQILAAVAVTLGPFRIEHVTIPFVWYTIDLGILSYPVTVFWIVSITNAMNFVDGIDGLAGGASAIAVLFFAIIALLLGQAVTALLAIGQWEQSQDIQDLGFWRAFMARRDFASLFPDIVDLPLKPLENLIRLFFVFECIYCNFSGMNCDDLSLCPEGHGRGILEVFKATQYGIEIGKCLTDVLIQMGNTVKGLKTGVALWPGDFFTIAFE